MLFGRRSKPRLIKIRGFEPPTASNNPVDGKLRLKKEVEGKVEGLEEIRGFCLGKKLSVNVRFFLYDGTGGTAQPEGRTRKDLDNMLKIVVDVLPEKMDKDGKHDGLGLIRGDADDMVYEIRAVKETVSNIDKEGMDIEISEFKG